MSRKIIIAMSGWKYSGKDSAMKSVYDILNQDVYENRIDSVKLESFAYPFKKIIKDIFGVDEASVADKDAKLPETKYFFKKLKSYRELCIMIGEGMKNIMGCQQLWANTVENHIKEFFAKDTDKDLVFIIPDVRYASEINMLSRMKKNGIEVYHYCIFRREEIPSWAKKNIKPWLPENKTYRKTHCIDRSEYEWCQVNPTLTDKITNDGTLEELREQVKSKIVDKIWPETE